MILEDDNGSPLPESVAQVYVLENECATLNQIDEAVEQFKNIALPHIEQTLLSQSQQRFTAQEKKTLRKVPASLGIPVATAFHGAGEKNSVCVLRAKGALRFRRGTGNLSLGSNSF